MGLFGGGGTAKNKAWDEIKDTYWPQAKAGVGAYNAFNSLLGLNGVPANREAYDNFLNNSGFDWIMDDAMQGVTNSAAGKYFLRSGATAKAMQDRAANIGKTFFDNYLDRVGQSSQMGMGAGNLMVGAGQTAGGGGGGLGSALGAAASIASMFSDRRTKTKIELLRRDSDGLGWYSFAYRWSPDEMLEGVMADEVAELRPWALGPEVRGYQTVNYGAL